MGKHDYGTRSLQELPSVDSRGDTSLARERSHSLNGDHTQYRRYSSSLSIPLLHPSTKEEESYAAWFKKQHLSLKISLAFLQPILVAVFTTAYVITTATFSETFFPGNPLGYFFIINSGIFNYLQSAQGTSKALPLFKKIWTEDKRLFFAYGISALANAVAVSATMRNDHVADRLGALRDPFLLFFCITRTLICFSSAHGTHQYLKSLKGQSKLKFSAYLTLGFLFNVGFFLGTAKTIRHLIEKDSYQPADTLLALFTDVNSVTRIASLAVSSFAALLCMCSLAFMATNSLRMFTGFLKNLVTPSDTQETRPTALRAGSEVLLFVLGMASMVAAFTLNGLEAAPTLKSAAALIFGMWSAFVPAGLVNWKFAREFIFSTLNADKWPHCRREREANTGIHTSVL